MQAKITNFPFSIAQIGDVGLWDAGIFSDLIGWNIAIQKFFDLVVYLHKFLLFPGVTKIFVFKEWSQTGDLLKS